MAETGLGGQVLPDTVQKVRFLPGNFAGDEFDIQLKPGTAIALPVWPVFGELYDDGTQDDPDASYSFLYEVTTIEARLDGQVLFLGLPATMSRTVSAPSCSMSRSSTRSPSLAVPD